MKDERNIAKRPKFSGYKIKLMFFPIEILKVFQMLFTLSRKST